LLGIFGVLALALAVVGIYGVMSYSVRQRHHEIGLRLALGSSEAGVVRLVLAQGMRLVWIGIGIGTLLALLGARLIQSMLWGVGVADPVTFLAVAVLLTAVALLANGLPALRISRVDPLVAMRED
jgi:putative ABC transport system permease protein